MFSSLFNRHNKTKKSVNSLACTSPATRAKIKYSAKLTPLQAQIIERVEQDYLQAEQFFKRSFSRPELQFTLRGKSAGTAHLQLNKIRLNPILLAENPEAFLTQVVSHEIAHLISFQVYGKVKPHGPEWQGIMAQVFSLKPHTTHQLNTQSVTGQEFEYLCNCGSVNLSIRRHNRVQRGQNQYRCKICMQTLKPASEPS
jgi:SprT protein